MCVPIIGNSVVGLSLLKETAALMALMRQGPGAPEPSPAPEAVSGPTTEAGAGTAPVAAGSMQ